jgi:putative transposon-encoded protein
VIRHMGIKTKKFVWIWTTKIEIKFEKTSIGFGYPKK